ncbi:hypothetical protein FHT76_004612 [Rhizobium sp. BK176]|nr:hypothetical protein [Rhizobium sp. BK399]MCS3738086.1 hypothetical protein [Rhizobium sp. BK661]MCS4092934.1 hypothetical protein [Rhizobium sp. BK176]
MHWALAKPPIVRALCQNKTESPQILFRIRARLQRQRRRGQASMRMAGQQRLPVPADCPTNIHHRTGTRLPPCPAQTALPASITTG